MKKMIGRVTSNKLQKTATVLVERKKTHPFYGKIFLRTKKYLADDSVGVKMGDLVQIEKTRPISKRKHWRVIKIVGEDLVVLAKEKLKKEATEAIKEVLPEKKEVVKDVQPDLAEETKSHKTKDKVITKR